MNQPYHHENTVQTAQEEESYGYYIFAVKSWHEVAFVVIKNFILFWKINFNKIKVFDQHLTFNIGIFNL